MKAILLILICLTLGSPSFAKKKKKVESTPTTKALQLKTEVNFASGANVLGNYESMSEADASVEQEKRRIDIVEPRKNWNLKTKISKEWH